MSKEEIVEKRKWNERTEVLAKQNFRSGKEKSFVETFLIAREKFLTR